MDKLLEQVKDRHNEALELLEQAQNVLTNQIGNCEICTVDNPCHSCNLCRKVYGNIEKYLNE